MIAILGYHEIGEPGQKNFKNPFSIAYETFETHVRLIKEIGFESVSLKDLLACVLNNEKKLTGKVLFTFDDGHISNYSYATELLRNYGFKGTFFITTSNIGSGNQWMNATHIRELFAIGMELGSHTHTHAYLDELSNVQMFMELSKSREILEQIIGSEVRFLSCPGGRFDRRSRKMAQKTGYSLICTSVPGTNRRIKNQNVPLLERYLLKNSINHSNFLRIVTQKNNFFIDKSVYYTKVALRKLIGNQKYYSYWKKIRTRK